MKKTPRELYEELCREAPPRSRPRGSHCAAALMPDEVQALADVVRKLGVSAAMLTGRCRSAPIAEQRHIAMRLLERRGLSACAIGRVLKRDHSTVLYGLRIAKERAKRDQSFAARLADLGVTDER